MTLAPLLPLLAGDASVAAALAALGTDPRAEVALPRGVRAPLLALAAGDRPVVLAVTATAREAEDLGPPPGARTVLRTARAIGADSAAISCEQRLRS